MNTDALGLEIAVMYKIIKTILNLEANGDIVISSFGDETALVN